ncbi:Gluconate 5-dehydrogenase (plasmid) [Sulfitobacter sp. DSM 110093]|uniref:SDR family NAD(P)-dependent oxidoreductase n=1 Tax=Sulfitobacter sp. DSM 110093 TaxID=2883127 RepID=UPI001FAB91D0|nr:glucose 1-dehydrogenase [Sulfitobacter sp. DSM 110093]UOA33659.1 Gluconate 5-dehydrogenase [Sulfitobacter sp. DSM 110093]UOA33920.1 Gluconate 5-dehydrogenase [Sulfitobacter sp. DSM 110093]
MELPRTPSMRLTGKHALVAGASRGIGLAIAAALAEAGANVTLAARSEALLKKVVTALRAEGKNAHALALDVTDTDAVRRAVSDLAPLDILVNSTGLARHGPALDTDPQDFDAVMNVNLRAAYFLAQSAARAMQGRGGSILTVSSQMGHVGGVDRAVYSASKHAIEGMTKAMAIEFGPQNIRVNTLCPTFIRTPLTEATFADPEKRAWIESKIKLNRVGTEADIMGPAVFLCSDAAEMITGTHLLIDGGWTAG